MTTNVLNMFAPQGQPESGPDAPHYNPYLTDAVIEGKDKPDRTYTVNQNVISPNAWKTQPQTEQMLAATPVIESMEAVVPPMTHLESLQRSYEKMPDSEIFLDIVHASDSVTIVRQRALTPAA